MIYFILPEIEDTEKKIFKIKNESINKNNDHYGDHNDDDGDN